MERAMLADLVVRFTDAFNANDLEGVMALIAEDAVYEEFTGTINRGKAAIRAAFAPQFRGDVGKMRFDAEDLFVDATSAKPLIRSVLRLVTKRAPPGCRRPAILHVQNGLLQERRTYANTQGPPLEYR